MSKVYLKQADSYDHSVLYPAVKEIFLWSDLPQRINGDTTIVLKPNMLSRSAPEKAVTTHPAVVEVVIELLREMGAKAENITIADSSGGPQNPAVITANYKGCGYTDVAARQGVNLLLKVLTTAGWT